jgi:hypothetical protein
MRISTLIVGKHLYLQNKKSSCILYRLLFPRRNEYRPWYCWKLGYYTEGSAYSAFYEQNVLPYLAHLWRALGTFGTLAFDSHSPFRAHSQATLPRENSREEFPILEGCGMLSISGTSDRTPGISVRRGKVGPHKRV